MAVASFAGMSEMVVPLDGHDSSTRAITVAAGLAPQLRLGIRLFSVEGAGSADARAEWMRVQAAARAPGVELAVEVGTGIDVGGEIVATAGDDAVVCMATTASLRPHHGHVGSVAEGVARRLGRPMFVVGPKAGEGGATEKVVVAVDGSALSEAAVPVAADLAGSLGVPLWVVTVISPRDEAAAIAELGPAVVATEAGYVQRLAAEAAGDSPLDAEFEVLHRADPAAAIVDFLGDAGLAVMTTHGRSGLSRLFAGSVTTAVVAHSHRPVLVWRPVAV